MSPPSGEELATLAGTVLAAVLATWKAFSHHEAKKVRSETVSGRDLLEVKQTVARHGFRLDRIERDLGSHLDNSQNSLETVVRLEEQLRAMRDRFETYVKTWERVGSGAGEDRERQMRLLDAIADKLNVRV